MARSVTPCARTRVSIRLSPYERRLAAVVVPEMLSRLTKHVRRRLDCRGGRLWPQLTTIFIKTWARKTAAALSGSSLSWPPSLSPTIRNASSIAEVYAAEIDAAVSLSRLEPGRSSSFAGGFLPFGRKGGFCIVVGAHSAAPASTNIRAIARTRQSGSRRTAGARACRVSSQEERQMAYRFLALPYRPKTVITKLTGPRACRNGPV